MALNTFVGALFASGALAQNFDYVNKRYAELPDGVLHFALSRQQGGRTGNNALLRRDSDNFDISLNNSLTYFSTELEIGSEKQKVLVQVDTGSSDLWVMNSSNPYCSSNDNSDISSSNQIDCPTDIMFDSSLSSSYKSNDTDFSITYGDTTFANGTYAHDDIWFNGNKVSDANFALAENSNSTTAVWGIGLIYLEASVTTLKNGVFYPTYPNIPVQMKNQGLISHVGYSLFLNDLDADDGSLLFGGVDHSKYVGTLQSLPLLSSYVNAPPSTFTVNLGNITLYQGSKSGVLVNMNVGALLDSGSSYMSLPTRFVAALAESIGASVSSGYVLASCSLTGGLTFDLSGITVNVPFQQMLFPANAAKTQCILGVLADDKNIILGDTFLRSVYAVYDLENNEVALAASNFDSSSSADVEAFASTGIPSATQAPRYSSTKVNSLLTTFNQSFYQTGSKGKSYGDYPSGVTTSVVVAENNRTTNASSGSSSKSSVSATGSSSSATSSTHSRNAAPQVSNAFNPFNVFVGAIGALLYLF